MATRARLGYVLSDDSIVSVYHHWDGYPEWLGVTLTEQYNTDEKVRELIDGGNMSSCWSDSDSIMRNRNSLRRIQNQITMGVMTKHRSISKR